MVPSNTIARLSLYTTHLNAGDLFLLEACKVTSLGDSKGCSAVHIALNQGPQNGSCEMSTSGPEVGDIVIMQCDEFWADDDGVCSFVFYGEPF